jgi:NADH:ubiquinone oxidoreductase subunit B-like Fe-S oxidoreductase
MGVFLPGCPPHAEVIVNGIFDLFPDIEKPKYADESEEKKLGEMLQKILSMT